MSKEYGIDVRYNIKLLLDDILSFLKYYSSKEMISTIEIFEWLNKYGYISKNDKKSFTFFISLSSLFLKINWKKNYSPFIVKQIKNFDKRDLLGYLSSNPLMLSLKLQYEDNNVKWLSYNNVDNDISYIILNIDEIKTRRESIFSLKLVKDIVNIKYDKIDFYDFLNYVSYDRIEPLIRTGLIKIYNKYNNRINKITRSNYDIMKKNNLKIENWFVDLTFIKNIDEIEFVYLNLILNHYIEIRRFLMGILVMDRYGDEFIKFDRFNKSNSRLSRWFNLNYPSIINCINLCKETNILDYYLKENYEIVFFTNPIVLLGDLLYLINPNDEMLKNMIPVRNKNIYDRGYNIINIFNIKNKKDLKNVYVKLKNNKYDDAFIFDISGYAANKKSFEDAIWTSAIICKRKIDYNDFSKELEIYSGENFYYIPQLRYEMSKKLHITTNAFDELLLQRIMQDQINGEGKITLRMRETISNENSHRPLFLNNFKYSLMKIEK